MPGVNDIELTQRREVAEAQSVTTGHDRMAALVFVFVFVFVAVVGLCLGWDRGRLPDRGPAVTAAGGSKNAAAAGDIAPDLALYREVIAGVRSGRGYYAVAREKIPVYGFPISSPLNWRLPTYAWVLSRLPGTTWIQGLLVTLSVVGLGVAFVAQSRALGVGHAAVTTFLLFGVMRWAMDGDAYLAQEPWAATLILISLAALALADGNERWRLVAVLAGVSALLLRELSLPYCVAAGGVAVCRGRWREATGWTAGILLFFAFFAWHVGQVKAQLAGMEIATAGTAGLGQWLCFGGLDFVLLTTRMNSLLFAAPGWLLWIYVLAALVGLGRGRGQANQTACLAALLYLLAFAIAGRPENFYWGLMPAPLLAWGAASGGQALLACRAELIRWARPTLRAAVSGER